MGYASISNLYAVHGFVGSTAEVYCLEKLDGCLHSATRIRMADGTDSPIGSLARSGAVGGLVMGFDGERVVPTKILNVFNNGKSEDWLEVSGARRGVGRGHHKFVVRCTSNHKLWSDGRYVEAGSMMEGDSISLLREDMALTPLQRQILIGKMLGDGSLAEHGPHTASVEFSHTSSFEAYLDWCLVGLGNIAKTSKYKHVSGFGSDMIRSG